MKNFFRYGDRVIEYLTVYTNRKSIGISVSAKNGVRVSAPKWVNKKQIQEIVDGKAAWIWNKLGELAKNSPKSINHLEDEAELQYLGRVMYLKLVDAPNVKRSSVRVAGDMVIVTFPYGLEAEERMVKLKKLLVEWYKQRAVEILKERIEYFSKLMGVKPSNIRIKQQKTRWGSCSSRGNINFNWKLVMFPAGIIDYVVVHELAHLKEMNHSSSFWKVVETVLPDYKIRTKQLKEYARRLDFPE